MTEKTMVLQNEPMKNHTTFKTGGPAGLMILPVTRGQVIETVSTCVSNGLRYKVIGNGSNLLFPDGGFDGVVVKISENYGGVLHADENEITVLPGISLSALAGYALNRGLTGLEFASGIPGTLGGAVYMNAGAYGSEIKDVFLRAEVLLPETDEIMTLDRDGMLFGYRRSILQDKNAVLLNASIRLGKGRPEEIKGRMDELFAKRRERQPLEYPSAGSVFKRPETGYAGELIRKAGLAGYTVGGAQVSEMHCGFIINKNNASSADIRRLMDHIQKTVEESFGIRLEPEIGIIG